MADGIHNDCQVDELAGKTIEGDVRPPRCLNEPAQGPSPRWDHRKEWLESGRVWIRRLFARSVQIRLAHQANSMFCDSPKTVLLLSDQGTFSSLRGTPGRSHNLLDRKLVRHFVNQGRITASHSQVGSGQDVLCYALVLCLGGIILPG